jgi:galactokinase
MSGSLLTQINISAPGRVNLLGEHVDYNQGVVLPAAIDRRVQLSAKPLHQRILRLRAVDLDSEIEISLDNLQSKQDLSGNPLPGWALYPAGVAWVLQEQKRNPLGMEVTYSSDIPIGSGLSSSAAVEVAFAKMWQVASHWQIDPVELSLSCQKAEVEYVGVNCGAMDQITSSCGVEDHVLMIDLRGLQVMPIQLPENLAIVIADSKTPHHLAKSAYNDRRNTCDQAVQLLRAYIPGINSLRDVRLKDFDRIAAELPEIVRLRARHVVEEMARVELGIQCLLQGNKDGFGRLMLASHASLRDLYQVSTPELDCLVEIAKDIPGCWGARLTGAGFGGCTVNLVEDQKVEDFNHTISFEYNRLTQKSSAIYVCRASCGVLASIT